MKLPGFDRLHPQSNNFAVGVENKATHQTILEPLKKELFNFDISEGLVAVWHWHLQQVLHELHAYKFYLRSNLI